MHRLLPAALLVVLLIGCGQRVPPREARPAPRAAVPGPARAEGPAAKPAPVPRKARPAPPPPNPLVQASDEEGILRGTVVWQGPAPPAPEHAVSVNGKREMARPVPAVRIDPVTGGVAGALVWLAKAPEGAERPPALTVRLLQSRGAFRPAEQVVPVGSILRLRTTEEADFEASGAIRYSRRLQRGERAEVPLSRAGLVTVRSAARPWMRPAYLLVVDHPYHAVTARDGTFALPRLPAGEHEVVLWHPGPGKPAEVRLPVRLDGKHGKTVRWVLRP